MITAHEARGLTYAKEVIAAEARKAEVDKAARAAELERERWQKEVLPTVMAKIDERIRIASNDRKLFLKVIIGEYDQGRFLSDEATRQLERLGYSVAHGETYSEGSPGGAEYPETPASMTHSLTISWKPSVPNPYIPI